MWPDTSGLPSPRILSRTFDHIDEDGMQIVTMGDRIRVFEPLQKSPVLQGNAGDAMPLSASACAAASPPIPPPAIRDRQPSTVTFGHDFSKSGLYGQLWDIWRLFRLFKTRGEHDDQSRTVPAPGAAAPVADFCSVAAKLTRFRTCRQDHSASNAGAVSSYILSSLDKTNYLSELRQGDTVTGVRVSGDTRPLVVGRAKIETRPLLLIRAQMEMAR